MTEIGKQVFASKAKTLENIHNKLSMAKTLPVFMFYAKDYFADTNLLRNIQNFFAVKLSLSAHRRKKKILTRPQMPERTKAY
jgi:hypothetical protein